MPRAAQVLEFVPLLLRAEREREQRASDTIFCWAVDHYDAVHVQIDAWLGAALVEEKQ